MTDTPPETSPAPRKGRLSSGFSTMRDVVTFALGLIIIGFEVFVSAEVEPSVLAVGLAMTGLPVVFGADERRKGK